MANIIFLSRAVGYSFHYVTIWHIISTPTYTHL